MKTVRSINRIAAFIDAKVLRTMANLDKQLLMLSLVPRPPPRFYLAAVGKNWGMGMRLSYVTWYMHMYSTSVYVGSGCT